MLATLSGSHVCFVEEVPNQHWQRALRGLRAVGNHTQTQTPAQGPA